MRALLDSSPLAPGESPARKRKLAAILNADVVGFSRLMGEDEAGTHRALGSITGDVSADDLLGEIFSSFCIGK